MNPLDGTPAWVIHPLECGIPLQCDACAAPHLERFVLPTHWGNVRQRYSDNNTLPYSLGD